MPASVQPGKVVQIDGRPKMVTWLKPALIVPRVKENRHAIVVRGDDLVCIAGDDCEGFKHTWSRIGIGSGESFIVLLFRRKRKESVRMFLGALKLLPRKGL